MKNLIPVLLGCAALVALSALAVDAFDDRALMVSPPDAVAEGFIREVVTGRYSQARPYLANPDAMSENDLRAMEQSIEWRLGDVNDVEAKVVARTATSALVTVRVWTAKGSKSHSYALVFDGGEWKMDLGH